MGKKLKQVLEILLFIGWFPVAFLYFFAPAQELKLPPEVSLSNQRQWWMVLFNNKKIGYSYLTISPAKDGYSIEDFLYMKLTTFGKEQTLYSRLNGKVTKDLRIKHFSFSVTTPSGVNFSGSGKYQNGKLLITLYTPRGKEDITLDSPHPPYLPDLVYNIVNEKELKKGARYTFPLYDPLLGKEIKGTLEVGEKIPYRFMGGIITAYKVKFQYGETTVDAIIAPGIGVLEETSGAGFTLKRVTRQEALKPVEDVNIIWSVAIPANKKIDPSALTSITYRITGIELNQFDLDGGNQELEDNILIIKKAKIPINAKITLKPQLKKYLVATPFVQTGDPAFKKIVEENRGKNPIETARNLNHWVYSYLKKEPVISVPSALEVLQLKKGDCNEHATLLLALLRTAGIPSREVAGVVYQDGYFFYHAWVEIYINDWIPIDPTFDQFPADVTHIRFIAGGLDKQVKVLSMINRVKIEILDYTRR